MATDVDPFAVAVDVVDDAAGVCEPGSGLAGSKDPIELVWLEAHGVQPSPSIEPSALCGE